MAVFGVTEAGFILKRLEDIAADMRSDAQNKLPSIDTTVDSVPGTIIDVIADTQAEQWQLAQETYNARYPATAEGVQLDHIGQFNAIPRGTPKKSFLKEGYQGVDSTIIPAGNQLRSDRGDIFEVAVEGVLDDTKTNRVLVQVITVLNNHLYSVSIDANSVEYLSSGSATIEEITVGIVAKINEQSTFLLVNGTEKNISVGTFYITSNDGENAFEVGLTADFSLNSFWTPIEVFAQQTGPIEAEAGTITTIVTPVAGLTSVENFTEVTLGSDTESNDDYRLSLFQDVRRLGGGALEAIRDRILHTVLDVILVKGFENDTMVVDSNGRPPKSIEMLVEGGSDQDIAETLWMAKGGGIETFGTESVLILDSQGDERLIKFSRPTKAYLWFRITITVNLEYPPNGDLAIQEGIVLTGRNNFTIGDEILIQQFYCPIYDVQGVETALIEIAKTPDLTPPVSYVTTNIVLDDVDAPLFDISRVEVIQS